MNTERIACILCMHLAACRFLTHLTALMHLQNSIKQILPAAFYFSYTYTHGISLRIFIKDYIITQALTNKTALNYGFNWVCNCKPKAEI